MPTASQLTGPVAEHGEGPVWDDEGDRLLCVDLERGDLLAIAVQEADPTSATAGVRRVHVADALGVARPRAAGGWAFAVQRRFALLDGPLDDLFDGRSTPRMLTALWDDADHRMNEGGCDPQGRFFAGSMAYEESPGGGDLWRLDPDGTAQVVIRSVSISNGFGFSPDGSRAYYIDTPTRRVDQLVFDPATGNLLAREPFAALPEGSTGNPDGLTVDGEGGVWVALWEGGAVVRFDTDGALTERVDVGTPLTTAPTFGGPDRSTLYVTTSARGRDGDPLAGALFAWDSGVVGLPPLPFAG